MRMSYRLLALLLTAFLAVNAVSFVPVTESLAADGTAAQSSKNAGNQSDEDEEEALREAAAKAKAENEAKAAEKAKEEEAARAAEDARALQNAWDNLLSMHDAQLAGILKHTQTLNDSLPELTNSIQQSLSILEDEYQKLNALSQVNGMPSDLTVIVERFKRIQERINALIAPLTRTQEDLAKEKTSLELLQNSLSSQGDRVTPGVASRLKEANKSLEALQTRYKRILDPAFKLIKEVQDRMDAINKAMPTLWNNYYFQSSGQFYNIVAWARDIHNLGAIQELFSLRLTTEVPNTLSALAAVLVRLVTIMVLLILVAQALRRIARKKLPERLQGGVDRILRNSFFWIALGISIQFSSLSDGKLYPTIATLGTMGLCWGQMLLAWDLYELDKPDRTKLSPLWPMFPTLLIGMVLLNFDPFPLFTCVTWLAVQALDLWKAHRRPLPEHPLPRTLMRLYVVQLWITLIITLIGFARLSILISMCYTSISVTIMLCVAIVRVENLIDDHLPTEGSTAVMSKLAMALIVPIILLLAVMASMLWIVAYPGGYFLIQHVATMGFNVGNVSLNAIQVLSIVIAFYLTRALFAVGNTFMTSMQNEISRISVSLLAPIQTVYKCVLWACFGLYALKALGFNLSSLSMIAGGLSVGIGIGLQNMVQNFTSGISVIFGQTIREGDVVEVGGITGVVKRINIRSTMIETFDNAIIFIPNASFLNSSFTNWTHNNRRVRKEIAVGVAYGSDVEQCLKLLLQIAREHNQVLRYPEPAAYFTNFGASSLDLILRFWVREYNDALRITSEIRLSINRIFAENGIEISFPQLDVHLHEADDEDEEKNPALPGPEDKNTGQEDSTPPPAKA